MPSKASVAGPTFAPLEIAARKLTALWDRAAPRDFVDVYQLAQHFGRQVVLETARPIDAGIVPSLLADVMSQLRHNADGDLRLDPDVTDISALREFYTDWILQLRQLD